MEFMIRKIKLRAITALVLVFSLTGISYSTPLEFVYARYRDHLAWQKLMPQERNAVREEYFSQLIDHDDPSKGSFVQRYFIDESLGPNINSPVFLFLCGEGACSAKQLVSLKSVAKQFNAKMLALEHRYYGKSLPTSSFSTKGLQYLSVEAALKDVVSFQKYLTSTKQWQGKWVVFGGSYAGSLSAYYRTLYPNLVVGSLASSAPVIAKENFIEVDSHVTKVVGETCANQMRAAMREVEAAIPDPEKLTAIKKMFLASEIEDPLDFLSLVTEVGTIAVQFGEKDRFCKLLSTSKTPLQGFAFIARVMFSSILMKPVMFTPQGALSENPDDYDAIVGMRQWYYQSCNEYGYWQPAHPDANQSTRSSLLTLKYYQNICLRLFGKHMTPQTSVMNNKFYQPILNPASSNIYFTNGEQDPWSNLSVHAVNGNDTNPNHAYRMIQGAAHCADLMDPKEKDPESLKEARNKLAQLIQNWLAG